MENYELSLKNAHPKAKELLKDDFYWNPIEEFSPFGNDDGSDAFHGFREWRQDHKNHSPVKFIEQLLISWEYPKFDIYKLDSDEIEKYITAKTQIDTSGIEDQMPELMEQFNQIASGTGQEMTEEQIRQIFDQTSTSMGATFLYGIDNTIIAVGFGQFVLEGTIDGELKALTQLALKRELLPILIDKLDEHKNERVEKLNKMLVAVDGME